MASKHLVEVVELDNLPPGSNPFHHDAFSMGTPMGSNLLLMHGNHPSEKCGYLILINPFNGCRLRINLSDWWNLTPGAPVVTEWIKKYREENKVSFKEAVDTYKKEFVK